MNKEGVSHYSVLLVLSWSISIVQHVTVRCSLSYCHTEHCVKAFKEKLSRLSCFLVSMARIAGCNVDLSATNSAVCEICLQPKTSKRHVTALTGSLANSTAMGGHTLFIYMNIHGYGLQDCLQQVGPNNKLWITMRSV